MKNTQQCPKCGNHDILVIRKKGTTPNSPNYTGNPVPQQTIIRPSTYICKQCGYAEYWFDNQDELDTLISEQEDS